MDIIIAGDGEVGFHLARSLSKIKHNITVVDPHSELLGMLQADSDLLTIAGNSTSIETLKDKVSLLSKKLAVAPRFKL